MFLINNVVNNNQFVDVCQGWRMKKNLSKLALLRWIFKRYSRLMSPVELQPNDQDRYMKYVT